VDVTADKFESPVTHEDAGEKTRFNKYLKAIAYADKKFAAFGIGLNIFHYGRVSGDSTRSQVVSIRKATGKYNAVKT
jgi:hypothetical protein